ncbi:MAG: transposase [Acidobacteria bacterium]|nr:transposase [Acidobacteriota bacterium]
MESFRRKRIRLGVDLYCGEQCYFLTICTDGRRKHFQREEITRCVIAKLDAVASKERFAVHAYCVMPDHLHTLIYGLHPDSVLQKFVSRFKQVTSFEAKRDFGIRLWQNHFYDHILRQDESADSVAWYIWMNPVRKGLCNSPWDFPFSGSLTFDWKTLRPSLKDWRPPWKAS